LLSPLRYRRALTSSYQAARRDGHPSPVPAVPVVWRSWRRGPRGRRERRDWRAVGRGRHFHHVPAMP